MEVRWRGYERSPHRAISSPFVSMTDETGRLCGEEFFSPGDVLRGRSVGVLPRLCGCDLIGRHAGSERIPLGGIGGSNDQTCYNRCGKNILSPFHLYFPSSTLLNLRNYHRSVASN